jgi:hypothetical protein
MAVEYHIDTEARLLIARFSGEFTVGDVIRLRSLGRQDPRLQAGFSTIDDVTGVTEISMSQDDLARLAQQSVVQPGVRRALVAKTDLQFGMARMYQTFSEFSGQSFQVFRDIEAARAWLTGAADPLAD